MSNPRFYQVNFLSPKGWQNLRTTETLSNSIYNNYKKSALKVSYGSQIDGIELTIYFSYNQNDILSQKAGNKWVEDTLKSELKQMRTCHDVSKLWQWIATWKKLNNWN